MAADKQKHLSVNTAVTVDKPSFNTWARYIKFVNYLTSINSKKFQK